MLKENLEIPLHRSDPPDSTPLGNVAPRSVVSVWLLSAAILSLLQCGCGEEAEIRRYTVDKPHVLMRINSVQPREPRPAGPPSASVPTRMLAAIVPQEGQAWFFKLTGPEASVAQHTEAFESFVKSIRFSGTAKVKPEWDLPEGWTQQPGSEMRYATILVGAGALELTVTRLVAEHPDSVGYLLANINRIHRCHSTIKIIGP